jgi:hypothetical protein
MPDIPDLDQLAALARAWRDYINRHPSIDRDTRAAGFGAGLRICAEQVEETLARVNAEWEEAMHG